MEKTKKIENEVVEELNGFTIIRSIDTEELSGHAKVFYDVCEGEWQLESFATLSEAKAYCQGK